MVTSVVNLQIKHHHKQRARERERERGANARPQSHLNLFFDFGLILKSIQPSTTQIWVCEVAIDFDFILKKIMEAMVDKGSCHLSSSVGIQDNGIRNKRKYGTDPPLGDINKVLQLPPMDCANYEFGKSHNAPSFKQRGVCNICSLSQEQLEVATSDQNTVSFQELVSSSGCEGECKEEFKVDEIQDADWSGPTENQLEELVLGNLDLMFKSAIKKVASFGYSEEVATKGVLKAGICYGCKDAPTNVVENTLGYLKTGQEIVSSGDRVFPDLYHLEMYVLAEMVCVLREVRPFLSVGDAMWCLLLCDMNMTHACAMDWNPLTGNLGSEENSGSCLASVASQMKPEDSSCILGTPEPDSSKPKKPSYSEVKRSPFPSSDASEESSVNNDECVSSRSTSSRSSVSEEKSESCRKGRANNSRRESSLRQKSIHLEKTYRAYGAKGALRSGKLSGLSNFFSDKKYKSVPDSTTSNLKSASLKISKEVGLDASQTDRLPNLSTRARPTYEASLDSKTSDSVPGLPFASTELSLSLPSENNTGLRSVSNVETANSGCSGGSISDKLVAKSIPSDRDEILLKVIRALELQRQVWKEWGEQKVMQAARRLTKDKAELDTLRKEKEEAARVKKEKQALEENTKKKLAEMENALRKADGQVEWANAAVRRLDAQNCELRQAMEAAKQRAAESALSYKEVKQREKKTLKKFQTWEKQKAMFQEELATEKRNLSELQQHLAQAKELQDQLEARWKQEEKMKEEALMQANFERKERQQIEASAKSKEDMIKLKAESDFQRYRDDIWLLEKDIAQLRLKTDSSKIAALHWGSGVTYASRLTDGKNSSTLKEINPHRIYEMIQFQDIGIGDVQRERECVMCLTDEMSVVFLPCAHQVVCLKCNELHENEGMKDCPSCRTPIQRRVQVRWANS